MREDVYLGHNRLAIVELGPNGAQPMRDAATGVTLLYNGELYNQFELRRELASFGHSFRSHHSDTEVILRGYLQWGDGLLSRLRGMFAFAVLDVRDESVLLARDHFGEKPLYYCYDQAELVFSSELKSLVSWSPRSLDTAALSAYLTFGYVPAPLTPYKGVQKLLPAHSVRLFPRRSGCSGPTPVATRYWHGPWSVGGDPVVSKERFLEGITESVGLRTMSDVSYGVFLSGGLDSTLILQQLYRLVGPGVKTFSIGYAEASHDEAGVAEAVSKRYEGECHVLRLTSQDLLRLLPAFEKAYDEPFADSSALATLAVSQFASSHVKVCLGGDGGDELLGGYNHHRVLLNLEARMRGLGDWPRKAMATVGKKSVPRHMRGRGMVEMLGESSYDGYIGYHSDRWMADAAGLPPASAHHFEEAWSEADGGLLNRMCWADAAGYLANDILVKTDRASMAFSLELRAPLVDPKLFELAMRLPREERFSRGKGKVLVRETLSAEIGPDIVDRRKRGFSVPIGRWLEGELGNVVREALLDRHSFALELYGQEFVRGLWQRKALAHRDLSPYIWRLYVLERWRSQHAGAQ